VRSNYCNERYVARQEGILIVVDRTNQKQRTRQALVAAASALAANGHTVTTADVAEAAQVSVATAYRYFSNPNDLVLEAATPGVPQIMADLPDDPAATSRTASGPGTPPSVHEGSGVQPRLSIT
jgi:AcrR family transcriptional regulator